MNGWTSVKDGLPGEDIDVLAYMESGRYCIGIVNDGEWWDHASNGDFEGMDSDVMFWKPLDVAPVAK